MNTVIILAAGQGKRMKASLNKQYLILKNKPVLAHTIGAFERSPLIHEIILVVHEEEQELCRKNILEIYPYKKVKKVVKGGEERQESAYLGLQAMEEETEIVLIHDGARPFVTEQMIQQCIEEAKIYGAVSAGVPVKETVKMMGKDRFVRYTPKREDVWITQTPQAFQRDVIRKAHDFAIDQKILGTDDAMLVEHMGMKVKMVEGDYGNIKITTPEDLMAAEAIFDCKREKLGRERGEEKMLRIGQGYDVHRLVEGRKLIIGGVEIPNEKGLLGHSDADVLLHAIKDALLGAAALGDIGKHFPDTDERYRGASSIELLMEVNRMIMEKGYRVGNVDATIIAQKPKMAPYISKMRENIAQALGVHVDCVNVKATTTEGLGFTGTGEGIAAQAVANIMGIV